MKCEYCGTDKQTGKVCDKCGASLPEKKDEQYKSAPFFYNGYICYWLEKPQTDTVEFQFWLGMELIERIELSREFLRIRVPEMYDPMPFIWDLFLVARGEEEVIKWQETNNKFPATFEVRKIENTDKLRWLSLNNMQILQEFGR